MIVPDATVTGGERRHSIVEEDTQVESLGLSGAVTGAHTQLNGETRELGREGDRIYL